MADNKAQRPKFKRNRTSNPEKHFWGRVDASGGDDACWPYLGYRSPAGYGKTSVKIPPYSGAKAAHRVAHYFSTGEWSELRKTVIRHLCNNPPCCNPRHLRLGTYKENAQDAVAAGVRFDTYLERGSSHFASKLTETDVLDIRSRSRRGETNVSISADYGITPENVSSIKMRKTWTHI